MSGLPEGWVEISLGLAADFVMGQAPPGDACNKDGIGTPFVKAGEFGSEYPIVREWTIKPLKYAKATDVLICVVGATSGKLNLAIDCAIGRSVAAIRPSDAVGQRFLYYFLHTLVEGLRAGAVGSAQGVISREVLSEITTPLPPLPEQRRIVAKIDSLGARTTRARADLDRVPVLVERFKQAVLERAFDLPGAAVVSLEEIVDDGPANGWSPPSGPDARGAQTLRLSATTTGEIRLDEKATKRIYDTPGADSKYWLQPGDLLVQRANSLEYVGTAAIFDGPERTFIYPDLMMRIRIGEDATRKYVWRYLNFLRLRGYFMERATGTAGNMPKINAAVLKGVPIPLPPLPEQHAIVARIEAAFARIDRIAAETQKARELVDRLDAGILDKAFRGALVPQDPADEPASVLLERIRAERAATPKERRVRRVRRVGRPEVSR